MRVQELGICYGQCLDFALSHPTDSFHNILQFRYLEVNMPNIAIQFASRRRWDCFTISRRLHLSDQAAVSMGLSSEFVEFRLFQREP